ncbi:MAG TPA: Na+/H+ antiporter NhaA [Candidatus Lustribacter sp.]|nr:Na+/H+ antiporter NhaA [Candidatus Lustribacter sp.]
MPPRLFSPSTWRETRYVTEALRTETAGGALLLGAAVLALGWANSPAADGYLALRNHQVGPAALHLDLSLGQWAADGLLAVFFLVAGIELKREFVAGDLADPAKAVVPVAAAVCGVALPAIGYVVASGLAGGGAGTLAGWAIPTATDIAFALAVLALVGSHLPAALRAFLLTLAVVDDLIAITIIAVFYTNGLHLGLLALAALPLAVFALMLRRGLTHPALLAIPALLAWGLVHSSGVHATVAGVLLGLAVPVARHQGDVPGEDDPAPSLAERIEHKLRPLSAGVAVPVFAFFAAGVPVRGGGFLESLRDPAAVGVVTGLVLGKALGVFGGAWAFARFTKAELDEDLAWSDIAGVSLLAGAGFTVSLLIGALAFGEGSARDDHVKVAILIGSLLAAVLASVVLRRRNQHYQAILMKARRDEGGDDISDMFVRR